MYKVLKFKNICSYILKYSTSYMNIKLLLYFYLQEVCHVGLQQNRLDLLCQTELGSLQRDVWLGTIYDKDNWPLNVVSGEVQIQVSQNLNIEVCVDIPLRTDRKLPSTWKRSQCSIKNKELQCNILPDFPSVDRCLSLIGAMLRTPLQMTLGGTRLPLAEHRQETVICSLLPPLILQRTLVFIAASTLWESDPTYRRNQCKTKQE